MYLVESRTYADTKLRVDIFVQEHANGYVYKIHSPNGELLKSGNLMVGNLQEASRLASTEVARVNLLNG
jgi:hypothetical protein